MLRSPTAPLGLFPPGLFSLLPEKGEETAAALEDRGHGLGHVHRFLPEGRRGGCALQAVKYEIGNHLIFENMLPLGEGLPHDGQEHTELGYGYFPALDELGRGVQVSQQFGEMNLAVEDDAGKNLQRAMLPVPGWPGHGEDGWRPGQFGVQPQGGDDVGPAGLRFLPFAQEGSGLIQERFGVSLQGFPGWQLEAVLSQFLAQQFLDLGQGMAFGLPGLDELYPGQDGVVKVDDPLVHGHRPGQQARVIAPPGLEVMQGQPGLFEDLLDGEHEPLLFGQV